MILLKSTIISTVLSVFSSRLLRLHQTASSNLLSVGLLFLMKVISKSYRENLANLVERLLCGHGVYKGKKALSKTKLNNVIFDRVCANVIRSPAHYL